MQQDPLATYLNDHLAGSVMAIELLERLEENCTDEARRDVTHQLRLKVMADQSLLKDVLEARPAEQSAVKKAGAWIVEKLARAKIRLTEPAEAGLGELEALEVLSLGIEGKRCLWRVLAEVLPQPENPAWNWSELGADAARQRECVEAWRLEAARKVFLPG